MNKEINLQTINGNASDDFEFSALTSSGDRLVNEDTFGIDRVEDNYCFVVCDGLGGHGMGEIASNLVKEVFLERFRDDPLRSDYLPSAFELAQQTLENYQASQQIRNKMKTTAVVLTFAGGHIAAGHIGDSRLYAFRDGGVAYQTIDHSVPQMLVFSGQITPDEIRHHPERNKLLRAMGSEWNKPMYEIDRIGPANDYDAFLLCSDGFWEYIDEKTMVSLMKKAHTASEWLNLMHEVIKINGIGYSMDNYTAIAIKRTVK